MGFCFSRPPLLALHRLLCLHPAHHLIAMIVQGLLGGG
jgi:hypothetical protein